VSNQVVMKRQITVESPPPPQYGTKPATINECVIENWMPNLCPYDPNSQDQNKMESQYVYQHDIAHENVRNMHSRRLNRNENIEGSQYNSKHTFRPYREDHQQHIQLSLDQPNSRKRTSNGFEQNVTSEKRQKQGNKTDGSIKLSEVIDVIDSSDDDADVKYAGLVRKSLNRHSGNVQSQQSVNLPNKPLKMQDIRAQGTREEENTRLFSSKPGICDRITTDGESRNDFLAGLFDVTKIENMQMKYAGKELSPESSKLARIDNDENKSRKHKSMLSCHAQQNPNLVGPFVQSIITDDKSMRDNLYYTVHDPIQTPNNADVNLSHRRKLTNVTAREAAILTFIETKKRHDSIVSQYEHLQGRKRKRLKARYSRHMEGMHNELEKLVNRIDESNAKLQKMKKENEILELKLEKQASDHKNTLQAFLLANSNTLKIIHNKSE